MWQAGDGEAWYRSYCGACSISIDWQDIIHLVQDARVETPVAGRGEQITRSVSPSFRSQGVSGFRLGRPGNGKGTRFLRQLRCRSESPPSGWSLVPGARCLLSQYRRPPNMASSAVVPR